MWSPPLLPPLAWTALLTGAVAALAALGWHAASSRPHPAPADGTGPADAPATPPIPSPDPSAPRLMADR